MTGTAIVVIFLGTWIMFAAFGFARRLSSVVSLGGGLLAACVALVIAGLLTGGIKTHRESKEPPPKPNQSYAMPPSGPKAWYSGGTLHSATMAEWRTATYRNRLATSADFVCKMYQTEGKRVPPISEIKPLAVVLEREVSAACVKDADSMKVTEVISALLVYMQQSLEQ